MALPCHSLGAEKGWDKQVFKKREEEERQGHRKVKGWVHPDHTASYKDPAGDLSSQTTPGTWRLSTWREENPRASLSTLL